MSVLEQARQEIDAIDQKLMELFERRMHVVAEVARYKKEEGMEIFQPEREQQVIAKNIARIKDQELTGYGEKFLQDMMDTSKDYQKMIISKDE